MIDLGVVKNNGFNREKIFMKIKYKWIIPLLTLVTVGLVGCGNSNSSNKQASNTSKTQQSQKTQTLSGVYKIADKDADTDDNGNQQPSYYYFKQNGQVLWAQNETGDSDHGNYGNAARGTWKSLGNNMFKIHIKYVYDSNDFTFKAKKTGNKLHTYSNGRAKYEWDADDNYKQPDMTYSDFIVIFNDGKNSQREKVQENGYDDPDNDSSSSSSSSQQSSSPNINNAQDALDYLKQEKGDGDYTIDHGTFGMSDDPYATITNQSTGQRYYVHQNGKIEEK